MSRAVDGAMKPRHGQVLGLQREVKRPEAARPSAAIVGSTTDQSAPSSPSVRLLSVRATLLLLLGRGPGSLRPFARRGLTRPEKIR